MLCLGTALKQDAVPVVRRSRVPRRVLNARRRELGDRSDETIAPARNRGDELRLVRVVASTRRSVEIV
jgi:hypothetical protein